MIVYKAAVLKQFAADKGFDSLQVVVGRGVRVEGGVMLGDRLCWDKDWHATEAAARWAAAERLDEIARSLHNQANSLRRTPR